MDHFSGTMSMMTTVQMLGMGPARIAVGCDASGCWATYQTAASGEPAARVAVLVLEVYDRAQLRVDRLERPTVDRLERVGDAIHLTVSDRSRGIVVGAWFRPLPDGGFSVSVSPAEVYECKPDLYRLFAIDVLPGLVGCGPDGELLLPVNTGVLCRPANKPRASDRFLIYGEQSRWELLPTLPVCAAQTPAGGLVVLAASGAAETECRVATDGGGNGTVGLSMFWRSHDVTPLDQSTREIRFHPMPAGADITVFTADVLRRHVTDDLGKPPLAQRAAESPEVAQLLGAYILKLFYGVQAQGQMLGDAGGSTDGNVPRFLLTMTFDEAAVGLQSLRDAGVDRMYTQNVGWNFRGHDGAYPTRFPVEERVGGEAGFRALIAARHAVGDAMTVHDNYVDAYTISPDFDPELVTVDPYGQMQIRGFWGGGPSYLQWPLAFAERHLEDQMRRVRDLGVRGPYYLDGMGSPLYANHHPRHRGSRTELARGIDRLLRAARGLFGSAATETGFLYCSLTPDLVANPGGHDLVRLCRPDWPITGLLDQIVPLWQLVMSGLVVTENQGLSWTDTMRAVLLNQHPRYEWSTRPGVHPVLDRPMIGKIAARHALLIKRFGHLRTQRLVDYARDGDGVEHSRFEDGTRVSADFATGELLVNDERVARPAAFDSAPRRTEMPTAVAS
jgi:hypothetical protein